MMRVSPGDGGDEGAFSSRRVRGSMVSFAIGKAISAPLTFLLILVLAAVMSRAEYANYVAAVALLEIAVVLGTLGLEWVLQTTIAGVLVRGNAAQLVRAMLLMGALPVLPYAALAAGMWAFAPWIASAMGGVISVEVLRLYAIVLAMEGPTRMLRDQMLGALLMQRMCQLAQIVRIVVLFGAVGAWLALGREVDAATVARAEIAAAASSLLVALAAFVWRLRAAWPAAPMSGALDAWLGWRSARFAANAYGSFVLMLPLGTEVMTALVARYLGADATAAFGFVARLMETARRYLPMDMFYGVLRPAAIGRFESATGDAAFVQLVSDVNRMVGANLIVVGVGTAVALAAGDPIVALLSKGGVASPPLLLAALLGLLATHSIRRGVELIAYIVGQSAVFARAALASLVAPPLTVLLLTSTGVVQLAPIAVVAIDLAYSGLALVGLRRRGWRVDFEYRRWASILLATGLAGGAGATLLHFVPGLAGTIAATLLACACFAWLLVALRVLDATHRDWAMAMLRSRSAPARAHSAP
jgi:hypothetical protein